MVSYLVFKKLVFVRPRHDKEASDFTPKDIH